MSAIRNQTVETAGRCCAQRSFNFLKNVGMFIAIKALQPQLLSFLENVIGCQEE